MADPMALERSSAVATVLKLAREEAPPPVPSLAFPSRPFTPATHHARFGFEDVPAPLESGAATARVEVSEEPGGSGGGVAAVPATLEALHGASEAALGLVERLDGGGASAVAVLTALQRNVEVVASGLCDIGVGTQAKLTEVPPGLPPDARGVLDTAVTCRRRLLRSTVKLVEGSPEANTCVYAAFPALRLASAALYVSTAPDAASTSIGRIPLHVLKHVLKASKEPETDEALRDSGCLLAVLAMLTGSPMCMRWGSVDPPTVIPLSLDAPWVPMDAIVYAGGILKNASGLPANADWLLDHSCLEVLAGALAAVARCTAAAREEEWTGPSAKQAAQLAVQLVGCLRNLCLSSGQLPLVAASGVLASMMAAAPRLVKLKELCWNTARVLAKATLNDACRASVNASPGSLKCILRMLEVHREAPEVVLRLCFSLGNLTATNDGNRAALVLDLVALPALFAVIDTYCGRLAMGGDGDTPPASVLVNAVRVVANLAMSAEVGPAILEFGDGVVNLVSLVETVDVHAEEELMLNVVAAVTNISFYQTASGDDALHGNRLALVNTFTKLLHHRNPEAVHESVRALGNFSRDDDVRHALVGNGAVSALVALLRSPDTDPDTCFAACGVILNVVSSEEGKQALRAPGVGGVDALLRVLDTWWEAAAHRVPWCTLLLKALCNFVRGWQQPPGASPRFHPRLTAAQAASMFSSVGAIIDDVEDGVEAGGDAEALLDVARHLRGAVQELVGEDAVLDDDASHLEAI